MYIDLESGHELGPWGSSESLKSEFQNWPYFDLFLTLLVGLASSSNSMFVLCITSSQDISCSIWILHTRSLNLYCGREKNVSTASRS